MNGDCVECGEVFSAGHCFPYAPRPARSCTTGMTNPPAVPDPQPTITRAGVLDMQVCIPESCSDEQVMAFAEREFPCGTSLGWTIRREGDKALSDSPERNPCAERKGFVHVVLDA